MGTEIHTGTLERNPQSEWHDPESFGGWILTGQQQLQRDHLAGRLNQKPPRDVTGVHTGEWVVFTQLVQRVWNISDDGGWGKEWGATYREQTGHAWLPGDYFPNAPTIAFTPADESPVWHKAHHNLVGSAGPLTLADFGKRHRHGDSSSLTEVAYKTNCRVAHTTHQQGGRIILLKEVRSYENGELGEWQEIWERVTNATDSQQPIELEYDPRKHTREALLALQNCINRPLTIVASEAVQKTFYP